MDNEHVLPLSVAILMLTLRRCVAPDLMESINHLIRRLPKRLGVTSVVVDSPDMKTAFHTADRIAFLHEGRIYFYGLPEARRAARDPAIVNFIEGHSGDTD